MVDFLLAPIVFREGILRWLLFFVYGHSLSMSVFHVVETRREVLFFIFDVLPIGPDVGEYV